MGSIAVGSPVTLVVVGAGIIGTKHASLISQSADAHLLAIIDPTPIGRELAFSYNCAYFADVESLLSRSSELPDGAIICTPNETHVPIARKLASAGIHLLIEKPVSTSVDDGHELLRFCRDREVRVAVGHHRRLHAAILSAKSALEAGSIGTVVGVSGLWAALKTDSYFAGVGAWRRGPTAGVVLINLIHELDLLQYLIGPITRVHAEKSVSTRGYQAEEGAAISIRFANGVIGTFLVLDNSPSPFNIERGTGENEVFPFAGKDSYRIFGRYGVLSVPDNLIWNPVSLEKGWYSELTETHLEHQEQDVYQRQMENFIRVVRNQEKPSCSGEDGLAAVAVCEAVKESLATGEPASVRTVI
ncbi:uncharacterized protein PV06_01514 [Exophiala oligosperma]|uniref:Gfo/Idh/MocA-like oxidoreductase N-terminal domain-containing protein n=2 Tax=Chaetothyriales TaxID=34395 RepID=A0A0D2DS26_9EURO|nr:uncharacterized protein PV06_01514 [Exophiala oligosperma]KAJ9636449.1 hypothetical protein H2204_005282 [Knufia peltigerae]KIW45803.1 hypothetical protein PV06_01514 [Exophiala oligosperma]